MRIFLLTGVVSALSPSVPKADRVTFDFVEITKTAGMRIRLENISVSAQVAKIFELDSIGISLRHKAVDCKEAIEWAAEEGLLDWIPLGREASA